MPKSMRVTVKQPRNHLYLAISCTVTGYWIIPWELEKVFFFKIDKVRKARWSPFSCLRFTMKGKVAEIGTYHISHIYVYHIYI